MRSSLTRTFRFVVSHLPEPALRTRPSSRLLVVDRGQRLLLFRFTHRHGALSGQNYWATPGGAVEPGESFAQAALRELAEETGMKAIDPGPVVSVREATFQLPDGEWVLSHERYFFIQAPSEQVSAAAWTDLERELISAHRWWTMAELRATTETVWPQQLADLVAKALEDIFAPRGATQPSEPAPSS